MTPDTPAEVRRVEYERLDTVADLIDRALSKKLMGKFANYGEMLEAKKLLTEALGVARNGEDARV